MMPGAGRYGEIRDRHAGQALTMEAGNSITFAGNEEHTYENVGAESMIYQSR